MRTFVDKKALVIVPLFIFFIGTIAMPVMADDDDDGDDNRRAPPTADIKANSSDSPITIPYNSSAVVSWSSVNISSCFISPTGWTGISGSQSTGNLTTSQTYTLNCSGPGGQATDTITVNVTQQQQPVPTVSIVANPSQIMLGGSSILSWNSTNADSCTASSG